MHRYSPDYLGGVGSTSSPRGEKITPSPPQRFNFAACMHLRQMLKRFFLFLFIFLLSHNFAVCVHCLPLERTRHPRTAAAKDEEAKRFSTSPSRKPVAARKSSGQCGGDIRMRRPRVGHQAGGHPGGGCAADEYTDPKHNKCHNHTVVISMNPISALTYTVVYCTKNVMRLYQ